MLLAKARQLLGHGEAAHAALTEAERQLANTVDATQACLMESRSLLKMMDAKG